MFSSVKSTGCRNAGTVSFSLDADYLVRLRTFPFQNDPKTYHVLEGRVTNIGSQTAFEGTPRWKGIADLTYRQGPATVNWQIRYVGKGALYNIDPTSVDRSEALSVPFGAMIGARPAEKLRNRRSNGLRLEASTSAILTPAPRLLISPSTVSRLNPSRRTSGSVQICASTGIM